MGLCVDQARGLGHSQKARRAEQSLPSDHQQPMKDNGGPERARAQRHDCHGDGEEGGNEEKPPIEKGVSGLRHKGKGIDRMPAHESDERAECQPERDGAALFLPPDQWAAKDKLFHQSGQDEGDGGNPERFWREQIRRPAIRSRHQSEGHGQKCKSERTHSSELPISSGGPAEQEHWIALAGLRL